MPRCQAHEVGALHGTVFFPAEWVSPDKSSDPSSIQQHATWHIQNCFLRYYRPGRYTINEFSACLAKCRFSAVGRMWRGMRFCELIFLHSFRLLQRCSRVGCCTPQAVQRRPGALGAPAGAGHVGRARPVPPRLACLRSSAVGPQPGAHHLRCAPHTLSGEPTCSPSSRSTTTSLMSGREWKF